ncbi:MAG: PepSY domain-containing protein [Maricaulis sp.]|jgi:hypothetical protein|nr:PepSY domain-containing protein [Maricaulis sp.]
MTTLLRWTARVHKWLALLVGIQIVLWVAGGVVMTIIPLERVHGDQIVGPAPVVEIEYSELISVEAAVQAAALPDVIETVEVMGWLGRPVYRVENTLGSRHLVDARTGEVLTPVSAETAVELVSEIYLGDEAPSSVEYLETANMEYRGGPVPVWQVNYADEYGATFYVPAEWGVVRTRRNNEWRVFDFFWMLHVMGYWDRDDFNSLHLIAFALLSMVTVLGGLLLLIIKMQRSLRMALQQAGSRQKD